MYNKIQFPAIITAKPDFLDIWQRLDEEVEGSLCAYIKGFWSSVRLFDAAGMEWSVEKVIPIRKINAIERILAPICYNPKIKVKLSFENPNSYTLEKLQKEIIRIIGLDDDIYTQFNEADDIIKKINLASSFAEIAAVLKETKAIG